MPGIGPWKMFGIRGGLGLGLSLSPVLMHARQARHTSSFLPCQVAPATRDGSWGGRGEVPRLMACFAPRQEVGENKFGERELVTKAATRERCKPGVKET